MSLILEWFKLLSNGSYLPVFQRPATSVNVFPGPDSVHSMMSFGFTEPDNCDLAMNQPKPRSTPTFIDVLLEFETPHLDYRRIAKQRRKLLRSFRFSHSKQKQRLSALVAATELVSGLWPDRSVLPTRARNVVYLSKNATQGNTPIVLDSGASFCITPFIDDFVDTPQPTKAKEMKGIADALRIKGIGTVRWPIRDVFGRTRTITVCAFYVPDANICLFSPQQLFQEAQSGHCIMDHLKTVLELPGGGRLEFPYCPGSNIPFMYTDHYNKVGLTSAELPDPAGLPAVFDLVAAENANLTAAQKELLLWHFRLGHAGMGWVQSLMRKGKEEFGTEARPPILSTIHEKARSCDTPLCEACLLGKQHRRTPGSTVTKAKPEMEMAICRSHLNPGDCISLDQYESTVRGRLLNTYGKEKVSSRLVGGTIAVDHASGYVFLRHQQTLRAGDTVRSIREFEKEASRSGVHFKKFHADNFPFDSAEFKAHLNDRPGQSIEQEFSGVGAHHQNGVVERAIQTVTYLARSMMLHQLLHWPAAFDLKNWPTAMEQALFLYNHLPKERNGLAPVELFTGQKLASYDALTRARVWGCPCYVLDPRLQDGKKLPKFTPRSRHGMYLGVSPQC